MTPPTALRRRHYGYLIADSVKLFPERLALIGDDARLTYAELDLRANAVASTLVEKGIRPGDRVALLWQNDIRYFESLFGIVRAGAVAIPLNVRAGFHALACCVRDSEATAILPGPGKEDDAHRLAAASDDLPQVIGVDACAAGAMTFDPPRVDEHDVCLQPYTSGSTGVPKGVLLTHAGQLWQLDSVRHAFMLDERERALVSAPVFHANAAVNVGSFLRAGASVAVMPRFDACAALEAIAMHQCTFVGGVPAMFHALVEARRQASEVDITSLRVAMVGSALMPSALRDEFEQLFEVPLLDAYGLTEGGPYVTVTPRWGVRRPGTVGLPIPGCQVRTVDPGTGLPVDDDSVGELWVRNPGMTVGYHGLAGLTQRRIRDGWLSTGDLARQDSDGFVTIVGRADDLLNVSGENVYPKEVEEILADHPAVREVAVVGRPDDRKGQVPVAFVVAKTESPPPPEDLVTFFLARGPRYAAPRCIIFKPALPTTSVGKIDRLSLEREAQSQTGVS